MNPPSVDIKDILEDAGVGVFAATVGWAIYVSREPDKPDTVITIYDIGGSSPNPKILLDFPNIQIRVRGAENDYVGTYSKALEVRDVLLGLPPQDINGTRYAGVWQVSDITYIGRDEERPIFTMNWRIAREPASGTYRV